MENLIFKVDKIIAETESSKTFYLSSNQNVLYRAGQFLTFLLNIYGKEIRRSYSFGSTPGVDHQVFITIKRIDNGAVSRYLFQHIKEGDTLVSLPPSGRFVFKEFHAGTYFFIAAGSGIVPIFSLLKQLLHQHQNNVVLLYQNVSEEASIYRKSLINLKLQFAERFTFVEVFSKPKSGIPQRLNNSLLENIVEQYQQSNLLFYLCGPLQFMRMAYFTLRVMGYKEDEIKKENFVVDYITNAPFLEDTTPKNVFIKYDNSVHQIQVTYPNSILEAALKNGIQLPYSCRGGRCSTCVATCKKGEVKMSINDVLTAKDLEKGLILTCVAYPLTDVGIEF